LNYIYIFEKTWGLGIGDWGLGIWGWGLGGRPPNPKPQTQTPNKIK